MQIRSWALLTLLSFPVGCGRTDTPSSPPVPTARAPAVSTAPAGSGAPATARSTADVPDLADKLHGVWVADDVDAKIGQVKIKLTFRDEGRMKLAAWSDIPFVGQVRDRKGPYEVNGNVLSSAAIRDGTSVEFWFDGDDLIIKYKEGKTVRFHRE